MDKRKILWFGFGAAILVLGWMFFANKVVPRNDSTMCANRLVLLSNAAADYAKEHGNMFPTDLASLSNELVRPNLLVCPMDKYREPAKGWEIFDRERHTSYDFPGMGLSNTNKDEEIFKCTIHEHVGFPDGTVFDGKSRKGHEKL